MESQREWIKKKKIIVKKTIMSLRGFILIKRNHFFQIVLYTFLSFLYIPMSLLTFSLYLIISTFIHFLSIPLSPIILCTILYLLSSLFFSVPLFLLFKLFLSLQSLLLVLFPSLSLHSFPHTLSLLFSFFSPSFLSYKVDILNQVLLTKQ